MGEVRRVGHSCNSAVAVHQRPIASPTSPPLASAAPAAHRRGRAPPASSPPPTTETTMLPRPTADRLIAAKDLIADGIEHGSRVVERSQRSLSRRVFAALGTLTERDDQAMRYESALWLVLGLGHRNLRLVSRLTSLALDSAHRIAGPILADGEASEAPIAMRSDIVGTRPWLWDGFVALVNAAVGDHLAATANPLAIAMTLRVDDTFVTPSAPEVAALFGAAPARICVFVHGLGATEWSWAWEAERHHGAADVTYGSQLRDDLGFVPVYVRYNGGLHISDNGRRLADLLESLVEALPAGVDQIALVGHSMGGLVAHSAAHYGRAGGHGWLDSLRHVVTLAAPHDGAPLEKLGHLAATLLGSVDLPGTRIPADVIDARSAGIQDLRHGYIVEEDWRHDEGDPPAGGGRTHAPWVDGVRYHRIVATVTADPQHPLGRLVGDTMVRPASAAASRSAGGPDDHPGEVAVVGGISHIALANHPAVYAYLRVWLREAADGSADGAG